MQQEAIRQKTVFVNAKARHVTRLDLMSRQNTLRECVENSLQHYLANLDGHPPSNMYDMVLAEVEAPLLEVVMRHTRRNQCKAAEILGVSRGTLRKKLQQYNLL